MRARRDPGAVSAALDRVRRTAAGDGNLLPPMRAALAVSATVGEVCDALREVFGVHRPGGAL
jgi:methylmalonyl-CoA mutase N-terminal domain/subunit